MDQAGLAYRQRGNCSVWVEDPLRAQTLLDQQLRTDWPRLLGRLLDQAHSLHKQMCRPIAQSERRRAGAVTRQRWLLRAHGQLRKVSGTHRYVLTESGRTIITALLAARQTDVQQLTALAA